MEGINLQSATTTKENPNAVSKVYYDGKGFDLEVVVSEGCAREYKIYETTSGEIGDPISVNSKNIRISDYVEGTNKMRTFEIEVYYGNKLQTMVLENNKYVSYGEADGTYDKVVTHKVEVIYDDVAPVCTSFYSKNLTAGTRTLSFTCTDDTHISTELTNLSISYENNNGPFFGSSLSASTKNVKVERISESEMKIKLPITVKYNKNIPNPRIFLNATVKDNFGNAKTYKLGGIINVSK